MEKQDIQWKLVGYRRPVRVKVCHDRNVVIYNVISYRIWVCDKLWNCSQYNTHGKNQNYRMLFTGKLEP